ncbi:MAG: Rad52/Rad22 family DNA repair protein [Terriglobales bacterium]|jgi:hypothetical protein
MSNENAPTLPAERDVKNLLEELAVPFPPHQILWRVTNTSNDKKRGQIVAYADPRAYSDRLNALFSPQGWTRDYKVETMNNITRVKKGETIVSGKVLVTCTVTIVCIGAHAGTGEEWADDDNGMTSADAQAFKRACSCFGLGRYFYDFKAPWVDLDQHRQPVKTPTLPAWAIPENWRKGMRAPEKNDNGNCASAPNGARPNSTADGNGRSGVTGKSAIPNGASNGHNDNGHGTGDANGGDSADLDARILGMEKAVGTAFYRNILREYCRVNQPKLIRDIAVKQKVLRMLESATRGFDRLEAVTKRLEPNTVAALLAKLQAPALNEIADMKTLEHVVFGLEGLAGPNQHNAA